MVVAVVVKHRSVQKHWRVIDLDPRDVRKVVKTECKPPRSSPESILKQGLLRIESRRYSYSFDRRRR